MKAIYAVIFTIAMAFVGHVEAAEKIHPLPTKTKIYIQGAGPDNRYMLYMFSTENCARAYGVVDTVTGKELDLPQTSFSCTFSFAPRIVPGEGGLSVVQKMDRDSYYVKDMESI